MAPKDKAAMIIGGGYSSRMGYPKPLLRLGRETVIERIIGLFRRVGIEEILAVLGHEPQSIIPLLEERCVSWIINKHYDLGMLSSIQAGARHLSGKCRGFFLLPADIPLVRAGTLEALMSAFRERNGGVCRPMYRGRCGHPPLIPALLIPSICEYRGGGGLRALLSLHKDIITDVDCDDPGIIMDLDTPDDYLSAIAYIQNERP